MPGFSHEALFSLLLLDTQPYLVGQAGMSCQRTVFYAGRNLHEPWNRIIKELPVAFAKIAFSFAALIIPTVPVFQTTATAYIEMFAYEAFIT